MRSVHTYICTRACAHVKKKKENHPRPSRRRSPHSKIRRFHSPSLRKNVSSLAQHTMEFIKEVRGIAFTLRTRVRDEEDSCESRSPRAPSISQLLPIAKREGGGREPSRLLPRRHRCSLVVERVKHNARKFPNTGTSAMRARKKEEFWQAQPGSSLRRNGKNAR